MKYDCEYNVSTFFIITGVGGVTDTGVFLQAIINKIPKAMNTLFIN